MSNPRIAATLVGWVWVSLLGASSSVVLADPAAPFVGEIVSVSGVALLRPDAATNRGSTKPAKAGDQVFAGDVINTSSTGGVKILFKDRTVVDLGPTTLFKIDQFTNAGSKQREAQLNVEYGSVRAAVTEKIEGKGKFNIKSKSATMGVRGTIAFAEVGSPGVGKTPDTNGGAKSNDPGHSTFLITQGQGVVTNGGGGGALPVVLNPGDQTKSSGDGGPAHKETLSPTQFAARVQTVQSMSRSTDNAFSLATNFDKAMEQRKQTEAANKSEKKEENKDKGGKSESKDAKGESKGDAKSDKAEKSEKSEKGDSKSEKGEGKSETAKNDAGTGDGKKETGDSGKKEGGESKPADTAKSDSGGGSKSEGKSETGTNTASSTGGDRSPASAPAAPAAGTLGGGMMESITSNIVAAAPPPPVISVTNLGIAGAPNPVQVLNQQSGTGVTPQQTTHHLKVNVKW